MKNSLFVLSILIFCFFTIAASCDRKPKTPDNTGQAESVDSGSATNDKSNQIIQHDSVTVITHTDPDQARLDSIKAAKSKKKN